MTSGRDAVKRRGSIRSSRKAGACGDPWGGTPFRLPTFEGTY